MLLQNILKISFSNEYMGQYFQLITFIKSIWIMAKDDKR